MNDLLPGELSGDMAPVETWQHVERTARELFSRFGYGEIRTPMVEDTALFVRSVGEETDIVGKEMYTFEDKAGRSLSMRPEGTAPAARAYIEHSVAEPGAADALVLHRPDVPVRADEDGPLPAVLPDRRGGVRLEARRRRTSS